MPRPDRPAPRVIGPVGGLAVVAGSMLGVGIFLSPPLVAAVAPGPLFWAVWVAAGLAALAGAMAYAELGALLPGAGGDYAFIRAAFGPHWAFAAGSLMFVGAFAGSLAAMSVALCQYQLWGLGLALGLPLPPEPGVWGPRLGAVLLILGFTALNLRGARPATLAQAALTGLPLLLLAALALWALGAGEGPGPAPAPTGAGLSGAWLAATFTYAGWPALVYVAGEVDRPARTLPLSLVGGTALVMALYLLLNAAMLAALGWEGLAASGEAGSAMARALGGEGLARGVGLLVALAIAASINGTVLGGARVAEAMALDGALPRWLAGRDARGRAPARALLTQAGLASALALSGGFTEALALTGVAMLAVGSVTVLALFRLRRLRPEPRPYAATAHPLSSAFYLLTSAAALGLVGGEALLPGASRLPLLGLVLLPAAWALHRAARSPRGKSHSATPPSGRGDTV